MVTLPSCSWQWYCSFM